MDTFTVDHSIRRGRRRADGTAPRWALARRLALGISLSLACQSALAQAMYRIESLGVLAGGCNYSGPIAAGFNGADQVTGYVECDSFGDTRGFLWKNNGTPMVDLGPAEAGSIAEGNAINASGLVAGDASDSTASWGFVTAVNGKPMKRIYDRLGGIFVIPQAINDLGQLSGYVDVGSGVHAFVLKNDGSPMLDLGTFGGDFSDGRAINASGQVAGGAGFSGNNASHAFIWKNDGTPILDLGTLGGQNSTAYYINAAGQVAGESDMPKGTKPAGSTHPFLWRNDGTPMQDLGTLGKGINTGGLSFPNALNDAGQVTGYAGHAFVWLNDGTRMKDLGTFGGIESAGFSINASGQVTGSADLAGNIVEHAFLWKNDGTKTQDLNKLIDPTDPLKPYVTLTRGVFIDDRSNIVAYGTDSRTGLGDLYLLRGTVLTLDPRSLAFGNQPIQTTSAARSVIVTNSSPKVAPITSISLTGPAAGQFASSNNCGKSLAGHATCTIKVAFGPSTRGAKSAVLNVNGGGGGLRSASLTGTGT